MFFNFFLSKTVFHWSFDYYVFKHFLFILNLNKIFFSISQEYCITNKPKLKYYWVNTFVYFEHFHFNDSIGLTLSKSNFEIFCKKVLHIVLLIPMHYFIGIHGDTSNMLHWQN